MKFRSLSVLFLAFLGLGVSALLGQDDVTVLKADKIVIEGNQDLGLAEGHVELIQGTQSLSGTQAFYYWQASTGVIYHAKGVSPPWQFTSERMIQKSKNIFMLSHGDLSSCNLDPPHFRLRSSRSRVITGERANLGNARLLVDEAPLFWTPIYSRSLVPKKYTMRIEPGQSGRDGITNKTLIGYPFTPHSYSRFRWDYLQKTGNGLGLEHRYSLPHIKGELDSYYIRDHNSDPEPQSRRYTILWNHYQRLANRITVHGKFDVKSDQTFGNQFSGVGNQIRVENSARGVFSEAGLTYQFPKATVQVDFDRRDRFDSTVSSENFISKLTLPRVNFNTIPLHWTHFPAYLSVSGNWVNETLTRTDPSDALRYQRSGGLGLELKKDLRLLNYFTLTPRAGYNQSWQDRDVSVSTSTKDVYFGRYNTGMDVRWRMWRLVDVTMGHSYQSRLERNRTTGDLDAPDRGVESNALNTSVVSRLGRSSRLSFRSGYDLRSAPRNDPSKYAHLSERIFSPSLDLQWQLTQKTNLFFRETYSLYNSGSRTPVRTPANTSGEIQWGDESQVTFFSYGFSYVKTAPNQNATLNLTNRLKMFLTPKWYVDLFLSYRAVGSEKLNYKKFLPTEKTINIVRDLHCWILRMSFSERTGRREVSFHIDMKANIRTEKDIFKRLGEAEFVPYRTETDSLSTVFE